MRNLVRTRTWTWPEIEQIVVEVGSLPLVLRPMFSVLAVRTKSGEQLPLYATTAMSRDLARTTIDGLVARGAVLGEYVQPSVFPMGLFRAVSEARRERERMQREARTADQRAKDSPDYDGTHL